MTRLEDRLSHLFQAEADAVAVETPPRELLQSRAVEVRRRRLSSLAVAGSMVMLAALVASVLAREDRPPAQLTIREASDRTALPTTTSTSTSITRPSPSTTQPLARPPGAVSAPTAPRTPTTAPPIPVTTTAPTARRCQADVENVYTPNYSARSPLGRLWVALDAGSIATSDDGGRTWRYHCRVLPIGTYDWSRTWVVHPVDDTRAWATNPHQSDIDETNVMRTGDGGATWRKVTMPLDKFIVRGAQFSDAYGWVWGSTADGPTYRYSPCSETGPDACTAPSPVARLFKTLDGDTWSQVSLPLQGQNGGIQGSFADADHGWISYELIGAHRLFTTDDGGATWRELELPGDVMIQSMSRANAQNGYLLTRDVGEGQFLVATTDGGDSWSTTVRRGGRLQEVRSITPTSAIAAGFDGQASLTSDAGSTWAPISTGAWSSSETLHAIATAAGRYVSLSGMGFYESEDGGRTWVAVTP